MTHGVDGAAPNIHSDGTGVYIQNEPFQHWFQTANERTEGLDLVAIAQVILQTAQLVLFYGLADDATDRRDAKIDKTIEFQQDLQDYKFNQDLPVLNLKASVLTDLELPTIDMCADALKVTTDAMNDGAAVDNKAFLFSEESCHGIPQGWGVHEGSLMAGKSGSYASGMIANNSKRRVEQFRIVKTDLVRAAQQGMKAVYSANETMAKYAQSASIDAGLADLFIQGFNSAGAGLGVALGRLANGTTNANPSTSVAGVSAANPLPNGSTDGVGSIL